MKLPTFAKSLPRKVMICGVRYRINYNMKGGACFDCVTCKIAVGCRSGRDTAVQSLIHEISEIVHVHMYNRFHNGGENGDNRFFMTHDDFDLHNTQLVAALQNCGMLR